MTKKYGLILLFAIMSVALGFHGQPEVFACHTLPCVSADLSEEPDVGNGVFEFRFSVNSQYFDNAAIQIGGYVECIADGRKCSNIEVKLGELSIPYKKRSKSFVKSTLCGGEELTFGYGPKPSYFLVVEIPSIENEIEGSYHKILTVRIESAKNLTWKPGNTVINKNYTNNDIDNHSNLCKVCPTSVPAVKTEISTVEQWLQLGPCKAKVKFDSDNNPLPFNQNAIRCPSGVALPDVETIPNERIAISVLPDKSTNGETISFVQENVKGQVGVAFKTGEDSTFWTYIPGVGWIKVTY